MADFTRAHPDLRLELVDRLEVGRHLILLELRLTSDERIDWGKKLRELPSVKEAEFLEATGNSEVYRVLITDRTFLPIVKKLKLFRHFPIPIQNGVASWAVVGPESKVRGLLATLETSHIHYELVSVRSGPLQRLSSSLTPRQQEILRRALAEGYFDVPRRVSLTRLAPKIGVATSTLSVTLAIIEKKIVESHPSSTALSSRKAP